MDVSPLSTSAVFLDITITIENNNTTTNLYEKALNKHLYLPACSAHPLGVLHGLIAGHMFGAYSLCTDKKDAIASIKKLWFHLHERGYASDTLNNIFKLAHQNRRTYAPPTQVREPHSPHWFFKIPYHPQDPPSSKIQEAWEKAVATPKLARPLANVDVKFRTLGHRRFIVCYNRPHNLGNLLSYRKILPTFGSNVSSFIE